MVIPKKSDTSVCVNNCFSKTVFIGLVVLFSKPLDINQLPNTKQMAKKKIHIATKLFFILSAPINVIYLLLHNFSINPFTIIYQTTNFTKTALIKDKTIINLSLPSYRFFMDDSL